MFIKDLVLYFIKKVLMGLILYLAWTVYQCRNQWVFNKNKRPLHLILAQAQTLHLEKKMSHHINAQTMEHWKRPNEC